jgi:DNA-binding NtrC family response regulator
VRELENLIHRELVLAEGPVLRVRPAASPAAAAGPPPRGASPHGASPLGLPASPAVSLELGFRRAKAMAVGAFERAFLASALAESGGNVSRAARLSGKERRAFGRLLKKHGLTGGGGT